MARKIKSNKVSQAAIQQAVEGASVNIGGTVAAAKPQSDESLEGQGATKPEPAQEAVSAAPKESVGLEPQEEAEQTQETIENQIEYQAGGHSIANKLDQLSEADARAYVASLPRVPHKNRKLTSVYMSETEIGAVKFLMDKYNAENPAQLSQNDTVIHYALKPLLETAVKAGYRVDPESEGKG